MDEKKVMNEIKEQCGGCEAWSGTDCTRNPYTQGCLKDEKKPTIEEIVKSIENCKKNNIENTCQYCYTCPASIWDFEEGITECNVDLFQKTIDLIHRLQSEKAEQKAEIERLTKWKDKLQDTKDDLEQQLIDTGFKEYCEENKRLEKENAELQKQVDELTKSQVKHIHIDEQFKKECEYEIKQAVKDTAKEIYDFAKQFFEWDEERFVSNLKGELYERYGVEVE